MCAQSLLSLPSDHVSHAQRYLTLFPNHEDGATRICLNAESSLKPLDLKSLTNQHARESWKQGDKVEVLWEEHGSRWKEGRIEHMEHILDSQKTLTIRIKHDPYSDRQNYNHGGSCTGPCCLRRISRYDATLIRPVHNQARSTDPNQPVFNDKLKVKLDVWLNEAKMSFCDDDYKELLFDKDHLRHQIEKKDVFAKNIQTVATLTINCRFCIYNSSKAITFNQQLVEMQRPPSEFLWEISDAGPMSEMRSAPNGFGFSSRVFTAFNLKWFVTLYPSGRDRDDRDNASISLSSASSTPAISAHTMYSVHLLDTGQKWMQSIKVDAGNKQKKSLLRTTAASFPTQSLRDLKKLSIQISIQFPHIYDAASNANISEHFVKQRVEEMPCIIKSDSFEWKVQDRLFCDERATSSFQSNVFYLFRHPFFLQIFPNQRRLRLQLKSADTAEWRSALVICTRCCLAVQGTETRKRLFFDASFKYEGGAFVEHKHEVVAALTGCAVTLTMELIAVCKGKSDVTQAFCSDLLLFNTFVRLRSATEMDERQRAMNREQLKAWFCQELRLPAYFGVFASQGIHDLEAMRTLGMSEIKAMVKSLGHQIKILHCIERLTVAKARTRGRDALRTWLQDTVKLAKYFPVFIKNDIEDLETAKMIQGAKGLEEIGVTSFGHRMRILHFLQKL